MEGVKNEISHGLRLTCLANRQGLRCFTYLLFVFTWCGTLSSSNNPGLVY